MSRAGRAPLGRGDFSWQARLLSMLILVLGCGLPTSDSLADQEEGWTNFNDLIEEESTSNPSSPAGSLPESGSFEQIVVSRGDAVSLVLLIHPKSGERIAMGTAWGVAPGVFATNGHIAGPVAKYLAAGIECQVQLNNSATKIYRVTSARAHPAYNAKDASFDVGVLRIESTDHPVLEVAGEAELRAMTAGMDVAFIGFPMEQLAQRNVNVQKPLASVQTGNIVAISDYSLKDAGFDNNYAIRHSIPSAGGASGSPIFSRSGHVIGLHNAGNYWQSVDIKKTESGGVGFVRQRRALASLVNFGVRVDLLNDLIK